MESTGIRAQSTETAGAFDMDDMYGYDYNDDEVEFYQSGMESDEDYNEEYFEAS